MAMWNIGEGPRQLHAPDDSLSGLAEFIIGMLGSEPTRMELSQVSHSHPLLN